MKQLTGDTSNQDLHRSPMTVRADHDHRGVDAHNLPEKRCHHIPVDGSPLGALADDPYGLVERHLRFQCEFVGDTGRLKARPCCLGEMHDRDNLDRCRRLRESGGLTTRLEARLGAVDSDHDPAKDGLAHRWHVVACRAFSRSHRSTSRVRCTRCGTTRATTLRVKQGVAPTGRMTRQASTSTNETAAGVAARQPRCVVGKITS